MKKQAFKILQWLDQVAADPAINDFAFRIAHGIAQNASLDYQVGNPSLGAKEGTGSFVIVGEPSVSYNALADQCRASKGGVRKAIKALEAREHIVCASAHSPIVPARYTLILHPRDPDRRHTGLELGEMRRLGDAYDLVEEMAVNPKKRRFRYKLGKDKLFTTPEDIDKRRTPTQRAALREARLRDRKR